MGGRSTIVAGNYRRGAHLVGEVLQGSMAVSRESEVAEAALTGALSGMNRSAMTRTRREAIVEC